VKLHPLSIPYRAVSGSFNVGTILFFVTVVGTGVDLQSATFLGFLAVYLVATALYQVAYYRRFEYALSSDSFDIASGVFARRQREVPLGRIQNVDVAQNPIQRALGIAALRIETAGGGETEATLRYVGRAEAERLRRELRRLARESEDGPERVAEDEAPATEADAPEDELVFALSNRNLVLLSLFTIDPGAGVISTVIGAVATGGDPRNLAGLGFLPDLPGGRFEAILVGVAGIALLAWALSVAITFARYYGFELRRSRNGLEYERGLLQRYTGTIPLEKVQTVSLRENVLKRRFGMATLAVETAGYSANQSGGGRQAAVPLADRERTVAIGQSIEAFEAPDLQRPPKRARQRYLFRYTLALLAVAGVGYGVARVAEVGPSPASPSWLALLAPLALVPVAAHYTWVHRGFEAQADHFVTRAGFWGRVTRVVPYYRTQTVVDARSVFQRRRRLGSVTADTASSASLVGGTATAVDVDEETAERLRELLRERLQERLRRERSHRRVRNRRQDEGEPSAR
jgi:putative membrane protein